MRDNALAIGGLLFTRVGGPSIKPYQPARPAWKKLAGGAKGEKRAYVHARNKGAAAYGRSLYVYAQADCTSHPALATFDAPSREICQVKRARTNTPLQALELLNDVTYVEAARQLAELALEHAGSSTEERITFAFRRALARMPTAKELDVLRRGFERYRKHYEADKQAALELIRHGESAVHPKIDPVPLAAYTATASVILNLDETITLE